MAINITKINKTSAETKSAIQRKSAQSLPNNPSERGYSAEEIKRRFYQPIIDAANSAITEIDRVVDEANNVLEKVGADFNDFIDSTEINDAYRVIFNNENWLLNESTNMYEILITKEEHGITDYTKIGVDMFLLDGSGNYIQVNQFEIQLDGTVKCFHESNGAGHVSIYEKREGFVLGSAIVEVDKIEGLAKVATTNDYNDLDNIPDTNLSKNNEIKIAQIIAGTQQVAKAKSADSATYAQNCDSATNATSAVNATNATSAVNATRATQDGDGNIISNTYAKQTGYYPNLVVRNATSAEQDSEGSIIKDTYAKQTGTYNGMSVGKAVIAQYSSDDTTKGTIEDRLTNLGFKQGSVILADDVTATQNVLTRQGNYVLGKLILQIPNRDYTTITQPYFYLPDDFSIKSGTELRIYYALGSTGISCGYFSNTLYSYGENAFCEYKIKEEVDTASTLVELNFGYEAEPLT